MFDVTRLSLLCQVGDDVIRPCKICAGGMPDTSLKIHSFKVVPYNLNSNLYYLEVRSSGHVECNEEIEKGFYRS